MSDLTGGGSATPREANQPEGARPDGMAPTGESSTRGLRPARKKRHVPNTISKRFRRKLRRARNPYYLWLQCKRPRVWARLTRFWSYRFLEMICSIPPYATPFVSLAPKVSADSIREQWRTDGAQA